MLLTTYKLCVIINIGGMIKLNAQSLKRARELIINILYNSNIKAEDKAELIINITALLNENTYDKQIKVLRKEKFKK